MWPAFSSASALSDSAAVAAPAKIKIREGRFISGTLLEWTGALLPSSSADSKDGRADGEDYGEARELSAGVFLQRLDREGGQRLFDGNKSVQAHSDAVRQKHETADGHSHHDARAIEKRPAAVAAMHRDIAAQDAQAVFLAVAGDHAFGDCLAEVLGQRRSNREDIGSGLDAARLTQWQIWIDVALELDEGDIAAAIRSDDLAVDLSSRYELNADVARVADDVLVGQQISVRRDHESGAHHVAGEDGDDSHSRVRDDG